MQTQIKLRSKLGALFVMMLIFGFGFFASRQQLRYAPSPTPIPAPAVSAKSPPAEEKAATALRQLEQFKIEYAQGGLKIAGKAYSPDWKFEEANLGGRPHIGDGESFTIWLPRAGVEAADAHNLYRMQRYQERVTRELNSRTPILPVSLVPVFAERISEDSRAR